jgi:beta-glucosidase
MRGFPEFVLLAGVFLSGAAGPCNLTAQESTLSSASRLATQAVSRLDQDWWKKRHESKLSEKQDMQQLDVLLLGDSITQGWETTGAEVWKQGFGDLTSLNLGFSGDRTEHVIWRLQNGEVDGLDPAAIMVLIGTNNTGHRLDPADDIAAGIKIILDELQTRCPNSRILLLSVFPYDRDSQSPRRRNNEALNGQIRHFHDGRRVFYHDIYDTFFDESGQMSAEITPDFLHLSERGYRIWAEGVRDPLRKWCQR